ncbi:MAG: YbfB/YjiJ family MFS transporter [Burkholderiales bacterium]
MLTLAVAMGIGRFAFTPVLPMMQKDAGLSLAAGGWLASANYVGYFVGALSAIWIRAAAPNVIRAALVAIALLTAGMGAVHDPLAWLVLRGLAGVASAWALVFASSWVLQQLAATGKDGLTGIVFGGVGLGTALAGGLCLVFLRLSWSSGEAWIALGAVALLLTLSIWPIYRTTDDIDARAPDAQRQAVSAPFRSSGNLDLVAHYACFGFGYIIPATFLPVMARQAIADPAIFGWAWPIFGAAALVSTLAAGWLSAHVRNRLLWAAGHGVMAIGVAVPVVWSGIGGIVLSALCVGGTFMVATLAAMQEARRVAPADSARLIAAMTAAFAVGQILGPVLVSSVAGGQRGLEMSLIAASIPLFLSALVLSLSGAGEPGRASAGR